MAGKGAGEYSTVLENNKPEIAEKNSMEVKYNNFCLDQFNDFY